MTETLRGDEEFVITAVAKHFSMPWVSGENPPDAYLIDGKTRIAVEISTLMQPISDERGTRSRITDDIPTTLFGEEINRELATLVPEGYRISLVGKSPILRRADTRRKLSSLLRRLLQDMQMFPRRQELHINENPIWVYLDQQPEAHPEKITLGFMHRNAVADVGANTRLILRDRVETKALKCAPFVEHGPVWLALFNDYWLTDADTYRYAWSMLSVSHPFARILIVSGGGAVEDILG